MKNMDRRGFIKHAMAGVGAITIPLTVTQGKILQSVRKQFSANERVLLDKTGIEVSRLALGSGTIGGNKRSNQTKLGTDKFVALMRHGFDRGITFWDAADQYGSMPYFREVLKYVPREKVVILTKSISRDAENMKKDIERFRKELGTDVIDVLLLHFLTEDNWTKKMQKTMDVVSEAKEKGIIRTYGCSCHSVGALQDAVKSTWTQFILARINHAGSRMDAEPSRVVPVLKEGHEAGKVIMGMKIIGEGDLKTQIDQSLKFVLNLGFIDAITIGFESIKEMDEVIEKIAKV